MPTRRIFGIGGYDPEDTRRQGCRPIQRNFLIVCEGRETEPNYFRAIKRIMKSGAGTKVEVVGAGAHTQDLLACAEHAIERRRIEGLPPYYYVWVVFDRDSFEADDFDNAVASAEKRGWNVAWSNEAFELWVLLHFQDVSEGYLPRAQMFEQLGKSFGAKYDKADIKLFDKIKKSSYVAIRRGRLLSERWKDVAPHEACPCTEVWRLVEELLKYT